MSGCICLLIERTWDIWLLQAHHRSAVTVFAEPQIIMHSLSKDLGVTLEAEKLLRRCSWFDRMVGYRGISVIGGINRVKFFLLAHFQMHKYISISHNM